MNEVMFKWVVEEIIELIRSMMNDSLNLFKGIAEALTSHNERLLYLEKKVHDMEMKELEELERELRR